MTHITDDEIRSAMEVLAMAVKGSMPPLLLTEFGEAMEDKYIFMRLDWAQTVQDAKVIGFRP